MSDEDMSNAPKGAAAGAVKLLPCPFCGDEAEIERYGTPRMSTIYRCTNCGCSLETGEEWGHGRDWNTRAAIQGAQRAAAASGVSHESDDGTGPLPIYSGKEIEE